MKGMAAWTMNEIYAANGDHWAMGWPSCNTITTPPTCQATYSMSFDLYVGDLLGLRQYRAYTPASATFEFYAVPETSGLVLAATGRRLVSRGMPSEKTRHNTLTVRVSGAVPANHDDRFHGHVTTHQKITLQGK